jgi:hypothetical protein
MAKQRLGWYRWEWADPYKPDMWTACTVSIYKPSFDYPFVSVLISIANGGGKVLMRVKTLEEAKRRTGMSDEGYERLSMAFTKAQEELEGIERGLKLIYGAKDLPPDAVIVRSDTGQIISESKAEYKVTTEAERILQEG